MNRSSQPLQSTSPLANTTLQVTITDLVVEYMVRHRFENQGDDAIEAVFSFPVPIDAAFLGMTATLAGETLMAEIQPQRQASRTYDDAIAQGHCAVLLVAPEPGLLCTSLGNLQPGETGEIELRFVTTLRIADRSARFSLPLVHRPRYGTWRLEELETPTHGFAVEHPMSASIRVVGLLASAPVTCATHAARFSREGETLELTIGQAMLDRDLVLAFDLRHDLVPTGHLIEDDDASLGLATFVLPVSRESPQPLDLCLVLDGSGSMAGDAIVQSRQAMVAITEALGGRDRIQILRFGSSVTPMFRRPLLATPCVRDALRELASIINADLGGTRMGDALDRALQQLVSVEKEHARAIILVTDGAVQPRDIADAQMAALRAGVRIFVVTVGSSAGTEVLGPLAAATGAVIERAVPAEPINACVMRQFRRAREVGAVTLHVSWPDEEALAIPMGLAYPGDAVSVAAYLPRATGSDLAIEASSLDFSLRLTMGSRASAPALRALLGMHRYRLSEAADRESIAMRYSLLTKDTSAVLVQLRDEQDQAKGLPQIVRVEQMVPEGMLADDHLQMRYMPMTGRASRAGSTSTVSRDVDACEFSVDGLDHYVSSRTWLGAAAAEATNLDSDDQTMKVAPAITADAAREIFLTLYPILLELLTARTTGLFKLETIITLLSDEMRATAQNLLVQCGLTAVDLEGNGAVRLLLVLNTVLGHAPFTNDQEAMLVVRMHRDSYFADSPIDMEQAWLKSLVSRVIQ